MTQAVLEQPDALGAAGGRPPPHGRPGRTGRARRGATPRRGPSPGHRPTSNSLTAPERPRPPTASPPSWWPCPGRPRPAPSRRGPRARRRWARRGVLGEQQTPPSLPVDQDRRVIVLVLAAGCWPATQVLASGSCRISTTSCRARRRSGRLVSTVPALSDNLRIGEASEDNPGRAEATVPGQGRVGPSGGVRGHHRTVPDDTADGAFEVLCWHSYFALIWGERARS
jgi:hypothetical protein